MAIRYYDDAVAQKLQSWMPESSKLRIIKPDETKRLFELLANDQNDTPIIMPFIALSRNTDIELISNIKQPRSYDGLRLRNINTETYTDFINPTPLLNILPIKVKYQLDIYTKYADEGDEYLRNFLFKLINNPTISIGIPYNSTNLQKEEPEIYLEHVANIRVLNTISDTSGIPQRLFSGQFTRWTIQLDLQDAFLFSVPYKKNWIINGTKLSCNCDQDL